MGYRRLVATRSSNRRAPTPVVCELAVRAVRRRNGCPHRDERRRRGPATPLQGPRSRGVEGRGCRTRSSRAARAARRPDPCVGDGRNQARSHGRPERERGASPRLVPRTSRSARWWMGIATPRPRDHRRPRPRSRPSPEVRAAVAWAMGGSGTAALSPTDTRPRGAGHGDDSRAWRGRDRVARIEWPRDVGPRRTRFPPLCHFETALRSGFRIAQGMVI